LWSDLKFIVVSEEHINSIFRVEEYTKQEASSKLTSGWLLGILFHPIYGNSTLLRKSVNMYRTKWRHIPEERILLSLSTLPRTFTFKIIIIILFITQGSLGSGLSEFCDICKPYTVVNQATRRDICV
jgi:hypothetical protein